MSGTIRPRNYRESAISCPLPPGARLAPFGHFSILKEPKGFTQARMAGELLRSSQGSEGSTHPSEESRQGEATATLRAIVSRIGRRTLMTAGLLVLVAAVLGSLGPRRVLGPAWPAAQRAWLIWTGGLVDAGGHRLRIDRKGEGAPTVVFDAGLNQSMDTWRNVRSEVAAFTRVVTYTRAGLGKGPAKSDRADGPRPRTSEHIVRDLHALLANAGIRPPYVLVGHSLGGLNVRLFATRYPSEVVGMVLVDSAHEDQIARFAALKPPEQREAYLRHESGENLEGVDLVSSGTQVRTAGPLPAMPFVVLTAHPPVDPSDPAAQRGLQAQTEMQQSLARLLPDGKHIIAENSGHFIQRDRPDLVVEAIRMVVEAARQRSSAPGRRVGAFGEEATVVQKAAQPMQVGARGL